MGLVMSFKLTSPRPLILFVSLILAASSVATLYSIHIPVIGHFVSAHRFWVMTAAYAALLAGVIFEGL
jgi:hypothetical protein